MERVSLVKKAGRNIKPAMNIPSLVSDFLASLDVKEITRDAYRKGLERFLSWLSSNNLQQPDRGAVIAFKEYLAGSGLSANTVNSYLVAVKRFFAYLEGVKKYPNIAKDVRGLKQPRGHMREALTIPQVKDLLDQLNTSTLRGKRDFALVNLMARTGLRTIEVSRADIEDIKQEGGEALLFIQGKGRDAKDDFVILIEPTLKPIRIYLKARSEADPAGPLFASLSDRNKGQRLSTRILRKIVKDNLRIVNIDNPKLSAHSLRHFFATQSLRAGAPLIQVKEALRHSSIATTQKYLHNIERIEKAAERYIDF